jgi:hypothetical protein
MCAMKAEMTLSIGWRFTPVTMTRLPLLTTPLPLLSVLLPVSITVEQLDGVHATAARLRLPSRRRAATTTTTTS